MVRLITGLLSIVILISSLTSCKDAIEVDELVYVASIGIDKGVSNFWRLSVIYPIMQKGEEKGQAGGDQNRYDVITMDAASFFTGVDMIDSNLSRHLNFQHLKFIVISEEIARSGLLRKYLAPINRFREIRRTAYVLVCKGSAKDFLEKNNPALGSSLTKNMEDWIKQVEHTGFYTNTTLKDFYNKMKSPYQQPTAILAAINKGNNFIEDAPKAERSINVKAEYTAGQLPSKGGNNVELFGCALFDRDKMVETLDGYETRLMLMVTGEFVNGSFTVHDPKIEDLFIAIKLETEKKPDIKVVFKENKPRIFVRLKLEGEILGIQGELNYEGKELKPVLEQSIVTQLKEDLDTLFKKCKAIREDVFGFGGIAARQFTTVDQWEQYNWFKHFENAEINTEVELTIKRSGTFVKTYPFKSTEGDK